MLSNQSRKRLPLKTVYYLLFLSFIVTPILIILITALLLLNQQFKKQAIETIKQAQETISTELSSDINVMSMRLSHLIYANNNEILQYAGETDTVNSLKRYEYSQKLTQAGSLALEPVKDIVSVEFYMKDGNKTFIKSDISRSQEEIRKAKWYQEAQKNLNTVCVGSYDTNAPNDLFTGGKKDQLILVFALAPNIETDRAQKVEMVTFYQSTAAADRIKRYNRYYTERKNRLGITQITDKDGSLVFSTQENNVPLVPSPGTTCVKTSFSFNDTVWYIESYITTSDLTSDFWKTASLLLGVAILFLAMAGYFSRYFLRSIVRPIEEISAGLHKVEDGDLEVHIVPTGQFEVRNMIHQFNAMVRRLQALISDYEERVRSAVRLPKNYFALLMKGEMTPEEVSQNSPEFFADSYALLGFYLENQKAGIYKTEYISSLIKRFESHPWFASRCIIYAENSHLLFVFCRILENDYVSKVSTMIKELQKTARQEFDLELSVCIGQRQFGFAAFNTQLAEIREKMCFRHLQGANAIIDLSADPDAMEQILTLSRNYERLSNSLYISDEKNMTQEKEKMFEKFSVCSGRELHLEIYAVILATGRRFQQDTSRFSDIFGQRYNYIDKISRIEDKKSLKLWFNNYFAWIMDYSASKLNLSETDSIIKAKRYIMDHYDDTEMSLTRVAGHVGLNEKYFTNRFTKETGETFSSYLTELRMQKARELLKTTTFKVYEIAEMVGYHNVEHFNRTFKKWNGISPAQYRKNS